MSKDKKAIIEVQGAAITILSRDNVDYISLTDMLHAKDGDFFISDWLRNRNTVEFLGIWERLYNPDFNSGEFAIIKSQVGLNSYKLSVKDWVGKTNAIGLRATAGRWIPVAITPEQARITYASEADVLNIAMFGQTAREWRDNHPKAAGNMRDDASIEQLLVVANLESLNAEFIHMGLAQGERLQKLNAIAIRQLRSLTSHVARQALGVTGNERGA